MSSIRVNVSLYGSIASIAGKRHVAQFDIELEQGSCKNDLLAKLSISKEERGYIFINAVLHDVPGLVTDCSEPLLDGDHVGIFSADRIWPYQYRDGVRISEGLKKAFEEYGAMHHAYIGATTE